MKTVTYDNTKTGVRIDSIMVNCDCEYCAETTGRGYSSINVVQHTK